jgi:tetratricopeptide (TPR) repeat protein
MQLEKRYSGIPSARKLNPKVSADFDMLLGKCMHPAPEQRYETAAQLAEDLNRLLQDRPLAHIGRVGIGDRISKFARRNRKKLAVSTCAIALVTLSMGYVYQERKARGLAEIQVSQLQTTAEKEADLALSRLPRDVYKYFLLGHEYFVGRQFGHAMRCFTRALELREDYGPAYFYRGRCFANLDKDAEALADYSIAIELNPTDYYALLTRATCYATSQTHSNVSSSLADLEKVRHLINGKNDESLKMIYLELARTRSALSTKLSNADQRAKILEIAKRDLFVALDLGLSIEYLKEMQENDRFRRLDPLFKAPGVIERLAEPKTIAGEETYPAAAENRANALP